MENKSAKYSYNDLYRRAEKLSLSISNRAWALARQAGCGMRIHMHNAMCDMERNPWPEINYKLLNKANYIDSKAFEPHRILDRLYRRLGPNAFDWS